MPEEYAIQAIQAVLSGQRAYCKFLAANDTGLTGGHQAGIYISKPSIPILFDEPGIKGTNKEKWVKVKWQDGIETDTRFIYYGKGTRNEYRITNFGRGFPFLRPEYTGALFVFAKCDVEDYQAFVLNSEEDIDQFLDAFGISPTETNQLIDAGRVQEETQERIAIQEFIAGLTVDFPLSEEMSAAARDIQNRVYDHLEFIRTNPDRKIIDWTNTEYALFRAIEHARYGDAIARGFTSVDEFITMANMVLNRRKSRAGKSLEHHLSAIFDGNEILYTAQAVTEGNKKPDFIFPSQASYHDMTFPTERLISLFRAIEHARYGDAIARGFTSVDEFITMANMVLNRRKSRAGKSLEHHLSAIFDGNEILYTAQAVTEGNKKPDFIFPSQVSYHDMTFPTDKLISLAAKTTCKDRWRQVINEADRLRDRPKYLCTLQQGISPAQMDEMQSENVILVVPRQYITSYPADRQDRIWTLSKFVSFVREVEGL